MKLEDAYPVITSFAGTSEHRLMMHMIALGSRLGDLLENQMDILDAHNFGLILQKTEEFILDKKLYPADAMALRLAISTQLGYQVRTVEEENGH